jgi:hypothetical protein
MDTHQPFGKCVNCNLSWATTGVGKSIGSKNWCRNNHGVALSALVKWIKV